MEKEFKKGGGLFSDLLGLVFGGDVISDLPKVQVEVLYYLVIDKMSPIQIHKKRKTSIQATRDTIYKLRAKGLINKLNRPNVDVLGKTSTENEVPKNEGAYFSSHPDKSLNKFRLHAQNISVKILKTSSQYFRILKHKTQFTLKGNTIQLYRNKVVIYSNTSFYSDDVDSCFSDSDVYWTSFMRILENELGLSLVNGKYTSIYQFRCHVGKTGDNLAKQVIKQKLEYEVLDDIGRIRLIIDNSKGLFEKEAIDNRLCQDDMKRIGNFELDLIEMKEDLTLSNVLDFMKMSTPILSKTNVMSSKIDELTMFFKGINEYNKNIKLHLEVQREQLKTQKVLQKLIEEKLK